MSDPAGMVVVQDLEARWPESRGSPLELFGSADPPASAGSYVIEPGERVPESGTTSHGGDELSVILDGEVVVGLPAGDRELTVGSESFVVIPAGVEHYSLNAGEEPVELVYVVLGDL